MAAARARTKSPVLTTRARGRGAALGIAACALAGGAILIGNPFSPSMLLPPKEQPAIRTGSAELSPPPAAPAPKPMPTPVVAEAALPPLSSAPPPPPVSIAPPPPVAVPASTKLGGGRRATIIVETLPAKSIIPPFAPKQPVGATPVPRPTLPLDTEIGASGDGDPGVPRPRPAMTIMARDG
jgi:hypothetical protein